MVIKTSRVTQKITQDVRQFSAPLDPTDGVYASVAEAQKYAYDKAQYPYVGQILTVCGDAGEPEYYSIQSDFSIAPMTSGGGTGTTNYDALINRPQINGVTLTGDKTLDQYGGMTTEQGTAIADKLTEVDAQLDNLENQSTAKWVILNETEARSKNNATAIGNFASFLDTVNGVEI